MVEERKEIKNKSSIGNNFFGDSIGSKLGSELPPDEQSISGLEIAPDGRPVIPVYNSKIITEADNIKLIEENYSDGKHPDD